MNRKRKFKHPPDLSAESGAVNPSFGCDWATREAFPSMTSATELNHKLLLPFPIDSFYILVISSFPTTFPITFASSSFDLRLS
jgi:hypothetical protein